MAALIAVPADREIKRLQAETQRLDLALRKADAHLKILESNRKITLELYNEVKKIIEKKAKDPREEDAVRVLVESLADDPFRRKLLRVIAVGAKSTDVKETAAANSKFYEEESIVQTGTAITPSSVTAASPVGVGAYNVDFLFCGKKRATSEPLAREALKLKASGDTGRGRIRALPESINQLPGYGITSSQIRFTPPEEKPVADSLAKSLAGKGVKVELHENVVPNAWVCQCFHLPMTQNWRKEIFP